MLQIDVLYLSVLKVKLYFTFMRTVVEILDRCEEIGERFDYYVEQVKGAFHSLNQVYLKYDPEFYSEQLSAANRNRAYIFRRMREMIRYQSLYADTEEKKLAAGRLLKITDLYGGSSIPDQSFKAMTASVANVVEDFEEKHQAEMETLGILALVTELKQAQQEFDRINLLRVEHNAENGKQAMAEARKNMDTAYRDLVTIVNLEAKRDDSELAEFIKMLNVVIAENRTYTGQGQVGSSSSGSGSSSDSDDSTGGAPVFKTATFKFVDGHIEGFPVEVGTPINAPANTEGYKWSPKIPEFMPKTNKTFTEVPIEAKEVTATFHFFDHREVEIKGRVGTALAAPQNTAGYVWEPSVPATMPEEDTSYYEMPIEEERTFIPVTFKYQNNTTVEREYFVGQRVTESDAPEPAEGMAWKYLPFTMPEVEGIVITDCPDYDVEDYRKITIRWKDSAAGINVEQEYSIGEIVEAPEPPAGKHWDTNIIGKPAVPMRVTNIFAVAD